MTLICLDLDGTLEDSRDDMTASVQRVRAVFKLPPRPGHAVRPHVNKGMDALYQACFDDFLAQGGSLAEVRQVYESDYSRHVADVTHLYPGMAEVLAALSELGKLAVVTNKPEGISRILLRVLGVDFLIGAVVGGDTLKCIKPDPAMMAAAADKLAVPRNPAVMIGDTAADIQMGRAFGAATIWCAWGYAMEPGEEPDAVAQKPADLPDLVRKLSTQRKEPAR